MEFYSSTERKAKEREGKEIYEEQKKLKNVMLGKRRQTQGYAYYMMSFIWNSIPGKTNLVVLEIKAMVD